MTTPQVPPGGYNCEQVWQLLYEYLDDALSQPERARLAAHLKHCLHCGHVARLQVSARALLVQCAEEAPGELCEKIRMRLSTVEIDLTLGPGDFPPPETDEQRIKRLSKFSTRGKEQPRPHNREVAIQERRQARGEMGFPGPLLTAELAPKPPPPPDEEEVAPTPKIHVAWIYGLGIVATLTLVILLVTQLWFSGTPVSIRNGHPPATTNFVAALLQADPEGLPLVTGAGASAPAIEERLLNDPQVTWPVVVPDFGAESAQYRAAGVATLADGTQVSAVRFDLEGHPALLTARPCAGPEAPIDGATLLSPLTIEDYTDFLATGSGSPRVVLWRHPIAGATLLYALVIWDPALSAEELQQLALSVRLEIEHRAKVQAGAIPGASGALN